MTCQAYGLRLLQYRSDPCVRTGRTDTKSHKNESIESNHTLNYPQHCFSRNEISASYLNIKDSMQEMVIPFAAFGSYRKTGTREFESDILVAKPCQP